MFQALSACQAAVPQLTPPPSQRCKEKEPRRRVFQQRCGIGRENNERERSQGTERRPGGRYRHSGPWLLRPFVGSGPASKAASVLRRWGKVLPGKGTRVQCRLRITQRSHSWPPGRPEMACSTRGLVWEQEFIAPFIGWRGRKESEEKKREWPESEGKQTRATPPIPPITELSYNPPLQNHPCHKTAIQPGGPNEDSRSWLDPLTQSTRQRGGGVWQDCPQGVQADV